MRRLVAVALLVSLVLVGSAWADTKTIQDPNDDTGNTQGDIRSATASHTPSGKLKYTITMWNRITSTTGRPQVVVSLVANDSEANCDRGYEGLFLVGGDDGQVSRVCQNEPTGAFTATKVSPKTIVYKFSKASIDAPSKYFWGVRVAGDQTADKAPNDSRFLMWGWGQDGVKHKL